MHERPGLAAVISVLGPHVQIAVGGGKTMHLDTLSSIRGSNSGWIGTLFATSDPLASFMRPKQPRPDGHNARLHAVRL